MNLGRITTAPCIVTAAAPQPDDRCLDDAFRLANPSLCPAEPQLVIKPAVALACTLGSVQYTTTFIVNGVETDVTAQSVFQSSNTAVAVIGASSGNATGLTVGSATISATYQGKTVSASLDVLGDDCCDEITVAMLVVVDQSRSMQQAFNGAYPTKLHYAKAAATQFISEINTDKDLIGLMSFTAAGSTVHSVPVSDKAAVGALVPAITQTLQSTAFYDALAEAIDVLNAVTADRRMLVLISDGEDQTDSYNPANNPIELLSTFKAAGGIVLPLGVRAHDRGYWLLSNLATGGFFINAYDASADITLDYLSGLKSYVCAGPQCIPPGDEYVPTGMLNYCDFANWNVVDGHVDLLGSGFMDLLPGNGLYVDLAGSRTPYRGALISKTAIAITSGKTYRLGLVLSGNQRVNATPNTIQAKVFVRNTDGLTDPTNPPVATFVSGGGAAELETYEFAVSYGNANGETALSPVATEDNNSNSTFSISITADAMPAAAIARLWSRVQGTLDWRLVAESDPAAPSFTYTMSAADIAAAIAAGDIDPCDKPLDSNTTGTPIVLLNQSFTLNNFQQQFQEFNPSFTAPYNASVFISIQQTATPTGHDAIGLLLDSVTFSNATDQVTLLEDNFNEENVQYVPPACRYDGAGYGGPCCYHSYSFYEVEPPLPAIADPVKFRLTRSFAGDLDHFIFSFVTAEGETLSTHEAGSSPTSNIDPEQILPLEEAFYNELIATQMDDPRVTHVNVWRLAECTGNPAGPITGYRFLASVPKSALTLTDSMNCTDWIASAPATTPPTVNTTGGPGEELRSDVFTNICPPCDAITPDVQSQDPNPLPDIEAGVTPPQLFTSTKTYCASCEEGFLNLSTDSLIPVMTSNTAPSGVASASSAAVNNEAWRAFDGTSGRWAASTDTLPAWLQYQFTAAKNAKVYAITAYKASAAPRDFALQGSSNGTTWTTLDSRADVIFATGQRKLYLIETPGSYTYYRLNITEANPVIEGQIAEPNLNELELFDLPTSPCETATATSESSQPAADNAALTAATNAANARLNCIPAYTATENYTARCPVGTFGMDVTKSVTKTSLNSPDEASQDALAEATEQAEDELDCTQSNNEQAIAIPETGTASPYPSVKFVEGETGLITKVVVSLFGITHASPDDLQMLLVSPSGTKVKLWQNAGGVPPDGMTDVDIVLDDAAGSALPDSGPAIAGTYRPAQYAPGGGAGTPLEMASPAPALPYQTTLAAFIGEDANGAWALYVSDDLELYGGGIYGGWDITLTLA